MRRPGNLEMESGQSYEDAVYENDIDVRRFKKTEKAKEIPAAGSTQHRVILTLWILQVLVIITLAIFIGLLFIYYKNIKEEISQLKSNRKSSCCPEAWIPVGSKCYYFQENLETWERSRQECAKNYSVLLILKDKDELDSLLPFMKGNYYWIGLRRDTQNSSRWVWVDGYPLTFSTLWYETEPNNKGGNENCTEIWKPYQSVNDVRCDDQNPSICKAQSRC